MSSKSYFQAGMIVLVAFLATAFFAWSYTFEVAEVSRAQGQIIAMARTQVIQSANDGVVEQILVHEGQPVRRGEVLVRLEQNQAEASFRDSTAKVAALKANLARLRAEVFGRALQFPPEVQDFPAFRQNQTALFERRQRALQEEVGALHKSLALVKDELALNEPLVGKGDIAQVDVIRLRRQASEIQGAITNRQNKYFQDSQAEMTKAEEDLATQEQLLAERTATLERTELRAPMDGLVRKIQITTVGARVRPGEVVMDLLPSGSALVAEVKLRPADIAFVQPGAKVQLKLDAYDYSIYGSLQGTVSYVSPDALTEDTRTGEQVYYRTHIKMEIPEQARSGRRIELQPGMLVTAEIRTGQRTVFSYLSKPVTKTIGESFGER